MKAVLLFGLTALVPMSAHADRNGEPSRPKDFSHDFQVPARPPGPAGDIVLSEAFDLGIPASWTVVDNAPGGPVWSNLAVCGDSNFTSGAGDAACVNSDTFGQAEFDTELRTPVLDLRTFGAPASLTFNVNYQNYLNFDLFEVDVSINGAAGPWTNLLSWNEDHGTFGSAPGEAVNLDIASVAGQENVMFRFHYYDPNTGDNDWYVQVDDVVVDATTIGTLYAAPVELPGSSTWSLGALALLLAGLAFGAFRLTAIKGLDIDWPHRPVRGERVRFGLVFGTWAGFR
jgi:hypothetical protein